MHVRRYALEYTLDYIALAEFIFAVRSALVKCSSGTRPGVGGEGRRMLGVLGGSGVGSGLRFAR